MLLCHTNPGSNIDLGVETLIPLFIGKTVLHKAVQCAFLFIHWKLAQNGHSGFGPYTYVNLQLSHISTAILEESK
jgi:hypothetical protein